EIVGDTPVVSVADGKALFAGTSNAERTILRTVQSDFSDSDFVAEITLESMADIAFVGMGLGEPAADPNSPAINMRIHDQGNNGLLSMRNHTDVPLLSLTSAASDANPIRIRFEWDADADFGRFLIDTDFNGVFAEEHTSDVLDATGNSFSSLNSQFFFGGSRDVEYDDLVISFEDVSLAL
ncbi:MAG: hypothetical protein AAF497_25685, partial [Planctomycetota bacterium]